MGLSRRLKKIALKSEMISIDDQEYKELDSVYQLEFSKDFNEEQIYLNAKTKKEYVPEVKDNDGEISLEETEYSLIIPKEILKKIHRELIRIKHPDLNQTEEDHDDFKKIQKAYERKDAGVLIEFALKNNIDVKLEEEHLDEIENQLIKKEEELQNKKNTVRWVWCKSDKSVDFKQQVRNTMGIKEGDYQEWKLKQ